MIFCYTTPSHSPDIVVTQTPPHLPHSYRRKPENRFVNSPKTADVPALCFPTLASSHLVSAIARLAPAGRTQRRKFFFVIPFIGFQSVEIRTIRKYILVCTVLCIQIKISCICLNFMCLFLKNFPIALKRVPARLYAVKEVRNS